MPPIYPPKKSDYAFGCNECGKFAWWKSCFCPGENKGTFSQGRGYTSYYKNPKKVCGTRMFHGCPHELVVHCGNYWQSKQPDVDYGKFLEYFKDNISKNHIKKSIQPLIDKIITFIEKYDVIKKTFHENIKNKTYDNIVFDENIQREIVEIVEEYKKSKMVSLLSNKVRIAIYIVEMIGEYDNIRKQTLERLKEENK